MKYVYLLLLPLLVTTKVMLQGHYSKSKVRSLGDTFYLMGFIFTAISLITGILFFRTLPSLATLLFALLYGAVNYVYQVSYSAAFHAGPVSLTSIICNFNMIVIIPFSALVFKEEIGRYQWIGFGLVAAAMILLNKPSGDNEKKANLRWLLLALLTMVTSGFTGIIQSAYGKYFPPDEKNSFIVIGYVIAALLCFGTAWILKKKGGLSLFRPDFKFAGGVAIIGAALGFYNILIILAQEPGNFDSAVLFPVLSVLNFIMTMAASILFLKEHIKFRQWIGVLVGTAAVVLMNL